MGTQKRSRRSNQRQVSPRTAPPAPIQAPIQQPFHWRDHPLVVATLAAIGTFTVTTYAFKEVVIPTQIAEINNKIRNLPALEDQVKSLSDEKTKQAALIENLRRQVESFQDKDLFKSGYPFPVGLDQVQLGEPLSNVEKQFPNAKIDKSQPSYWDVNLGYGVVDDIVFYYDRHKKDKNVTQIGFWLNGKLNKTHNFLQDRLTDALGKPMRTPTHKDWAEWDLKRYTIFSQSSDSFSVLPPGEHPIAWMD